MQLMKYNNKLIYTNFTKNDLNHIRKDLTPNVNKIEIIMNNIGGRAFNNEINMITRLYDDIVDNKLPLRIILFTMNNEVHRIVRAALSIRNINEDAIIRLHGGRYDFVNRNDGLTYIFTKCKWKLLLTKTNYCDIYRQYVFNEDFFCSNYIQMYNESCLYRLKDENLILHDIVLENRVNVYPFNRVKDLVNGTKFVYNEYIQYRLKVSRHHELNIANNKSKE